MEPSTLITTDNRSPISSLKNIQSKLTQSRRSRVFSSDPTSPSSSSSTSASKSGFITKINEIRSNKSHIRQSMKNSLISKIKSDILNSPKRSIPSETNQSTIVTTATTTITTGTTNITNEVTKILQTNYAFSKKHLEMDKLIHKKTKKDTWGTSLFYDDTDKAEFPPRNHVHWEIEPITAPISTENSSILSSVRFQSDRSLLSQVNPNEMIRSVFSDRDDLNDLTEETKEKYFGSVAKKHFYETYSELNRMSKVVVGGLDGVEHVLHDHFNKKSNLLSSPSAAGVAVPSTGLLLGISSLPLSSRRDSIQSMHSLDEIPSNELDTMSALSWGIPVPSETSHLHLMIPSAPSSALASTLASASTSITATPISHSQMHSARNENRETDSVLKLPIISSASNMESPTTSELMNFQIDHMYDLYQSTYGPNSPRATFLLGCLHHNLPPRALAILRNKLTSTLDLSHLGLGDELIILLAKALADLPALEVIILKDNNLNDIGLETIINSISDHNGILELDLSSNKLGQRAAKALGKWISKPECPLIGLCVSADSVEDRECALFVDCLMKNTTLRELDLSNNLLGKDEQLNAFNSTMTAGQSLANLLCQGRCPLNKLNVHWNMIRMHGATELCDSIRYTNTLIHLNLSYNGIGRQASTTLGSALLENTCLEELVISNNSIDAIGCFTIVVGAREHPSLKFIDLDGNPIGEQGGRMLMKLAKYHGWRIKFSAFRCDANIQSKDVIFKTNEPIGSYQLDLSIPYHRAVACEILDVVALEPTLGFKYFEIKESGSKSFRSVNLVKFRQPIPPPNDVTKHDLNLLQAIVAIAKDNDLITRVFKIFDEDNSGQLDAHEFRHLLQKLGLDSSEEKVRAVMATLDADGESLIDFEETKGYIWNVARAARAQIKEIESYPCLSAIEANPLRKYNLPISGQVRLEVLESLENVEEPGCLTKQQCQWVMEAADRSNDPALLLQYGMEISTLYLDEAQTLFKCLQAYQDVNAVILSKIIPRMATTMDANSLVKIHFGSKTRTNRHLKRVLGMAYHPLLGMYNGYYYLDLIKETDRICLHKLMTQSIRKNANRLVSKRGDTSQNGNWSCFRNVRRDGKLIPLLAHEQFSPMPKFGILEFDYVDISRPNYDVDKPIEEIKFFQILRSCALIKNSTQLRLIRTKIRETERRLRLSLGEARATNSYYAPDTGRMINTFDHLTRMYKSLDHRYSSYERILRKEVYTDKGVNIDTMDDVIIIEANPYDERKDIFGAYDEDNDDDDDYENENDLIGAMTTVPQLQNVPLARKSSHLSLYRRPTSVSISSPRQNAATPTSPRPNGNPISPRTNAIIPTSPRVNNNNTSNNNGVAGSFKSMIQSPKGSFYINTNSNANANVNASVNVNANSNSPNTDILSPFRPKLLKSPSISSIATNTFSSFYKKTGSSESPVSLLRANSNRTNKLSNSPNRRDRNGFKNSPNNSNHSKSPRNRKNKMTTTNRNSNSNRNIFDNDKNNNLLSPIGVASLAIRVISSKETARFEKILNDSKAPSEFKSCILLHFLMTHLSNRYFKVSQLSILLELFHVGIVPKTIIGSYRVELVVFLFNRILDLHNFSEIIRVLTAEEHAAVLARLGYLNILNPTKLEGVYRLDLAKWEERQLAKMLIHVGITEPGTNWYEESFTFANHMEPMPGWTLTVVWYSDQGFPKQGILQLKMYSGEGVAYGDCKPDMSLRRMLLHHVLIDQKDIELDLLTIHHPDPENDPMHPHIRKESSKSPTSYIYPTEDDSNEEPEFRLLLRKQIRMEITDLNKFVLNDSLNHLSKKTPLTWTYFGNPVVAALTATNSNGNGMENAEANNLKTTTISNISNKLTTSTSSSNNNNSGSSSVLKKK